MSNLSIIPFYKNLTEIEISVSWFDVCNLKCDFCFEPKCEIRPINYDYCRNVKFLICKEFEKKLMKFPSAQGLRLAMWGGELFMDSIPDDLFSIYQETIDYIKTTLSKKYPSLYYKIIWASNGVFEKRDRVLALLKATDSAIGFSYDPVGRYATNSQLDTFKETFSFFKERGYVQCMSITPTKTVIDAIINSKRGELLPTDVYIDVNHYIANSHYERLLPTPVELFKFYKWCVDNEMVNVGILNSAIVSYFGLKQDCPRMCDCAACVVIRDGLITTDCVHYSTLPKERFYGKYADIVDETNTNEIKATLGQLKFNCLNCEHYNHCQMHCWMSVLFDGYNGGCPLKMLYAYLATKGRDAMVKMFEDSNFHMI